MINKEEEFGHIMLDLETWGNKPQSVIVSVAATEFNMETGKIGREFYEVIDAQSCLDMGMKINASTMYWWFAQSKDAIDQICRPSKVDIQTALFELKTFFEGLGYSPEVWANGLRFDVALMHDAYSLCGYHKVPWDFRKERDVRTLVSFAPQFKENHEWFGTTHNPKTDNRNQIKYCSTTWNNIFN